MRKDTVILAICVIAIASMTMVFLIRNIELDKETQSLERENARLKNDIDQLFSQLQAERTQRQNDVERLQRLAEENKFAFYYDPLTKQRYGVNELEDYLDRWKWTEGTYREGEFDCSEMSAHVEWKLENEGFHTSIVVGKALQGGDDQHAWLLVETSQGQYMPVEATRFDIVSWHNQYFDNYFEYDQQFETIEDALDYSYTEFDWWES